jgi:hypothetical protein
MPIRVEIEGPEFYDRFLVDDGTGTIAVESIPRAVRSALRSCNFKLIEIDEPPDAPDPRSLSPEPSQWEAP